MDLFVLDKLVIEFIKQLMTDPITQFSAALVVGTLVDVLIPDSKSSKGNKK